MGRRAQYQMHDTREAYQHDERSKLEDVLKSTVALAAYGRPTRILCVGERVFSLLRDLECSCVFCYRVLVSVEEASSDILLPDLKALSFATIVIQTTGNRTPSSDRLLPSLYALSFATSYLDHWESNSWACSSRRKPRSANKTLQSG